MTLTRFHCPRCGATLKSSQPIPRGKEVECRQCGDVFRVTGPSATADSAPSRGAKEDDFAWRDLDTAAGPSRGRRRPASRRRPDSNIALWIGVVALVAVVLIAGLIVGLWLHSRSDRAPVEDEVLGPRSLDDPQVTPETFQSVHAETTLRSLRIQLGPGREVSFDQLPLADRPAPGKEVRTNLRRLAEKYRIRSWYLWTGKGRWVFAGFRTERSSIVAWYYKKPDGTDEASLEDNENTLP